ncbi:hypothetical protein ES288_D12G135900v1 [Gossypium darwinii]|uniref:Uncharacterized protein n=1 Tax=Gossypium darwinii TaxID=34276 RepID=A0A5D2ABN3_GOSDA|nr:hypothetical protein ES288_D12G135900v1 [Gossypium darwinii]
MMTAPRRRTTTGTCMCGSCYDVGRCCEGRTWAVAAPAC